MWLLGCVVSIVLLVGVPTFLVARWGLRKGKNVIVYTYSLTVEEYNALATRLGLPLIGETSTVEVEVRSE